MLGTPNGGSWAPMQTLSGDDTFGNTLVAFGSLFDNGGARKMMAGMPGFIQLQAALLDPALGLDRASTWQKLADDDMAALRERSIWHSDEVQRSIYEWGAPPQAVLDQAVALRRRLDAQVDKLGADAQKMLLVIGHAAFTPAGIVTGPDGLEYLDTPDDGDGRVTLSSALLPGVRTWKVDAEHGKLPDVADAFAAYVELLSTGQTRLLEPFEPVARGARSAGGGAPLPRQRRSCAAGHRTACMVPSRRRARPMCWASAARATPPAQRARGKTAALSVTRAQRRSEVRAPAAARRPLPFDDS